MSTKPTTDTAARGAEGVPLDAPDNDAPAISPQAVSSTHRAEDDAAARAGSPDFSETPAGGAGPALRQPSTRATGSERGSTSASDSNSSAVKDSLASQESAKASRDANPGHGTRKEPTVAPRGAGDGELQEQPGSITEARQLGPDVPAPGAIRESK